MQSRPRDTRGEEPSPWLHSEVHPTMLRPELGWAPLNSQKRRSCYCFHRLLSYWRINIPPKTAAELEAESSLFVVGFPSGRYAATRRVSFHRLALALMAILTQACIGSVFAFNTLAPWLDNYFKETASFRIFLTSILSFGVVAAVSGPWLERCGLRLGLGVGCAMFGLGLILSQVAVAVQSIDLLYVGYGGLVGAGQGILLLSSISTVQKWFPDWRGIVTAICIGANSMGSVAWAWWYELLFRHSTALNYVFLLTGGISIVILAISAMVFRTPPPTFSVNGLDIHCLPVSSASRNAQAVDQCLGQGMTLVNYAALEPTQVETDKDYFEQVKGLTLAQCIFSTDFFWLYVACAANMMPGILFLPQAIQAFTNIANQSTQQAATFVWNISLSNCSGVIVAPLASDLLIRLFYVNPAFGRKLVFTVMLLTQAVMLPLVSANLTQPVPWYALTFACGGGFGLMPCLVSDLFGVYNSGTMYGLTLSSRAIGAAIVGFLLPSLQPTKSALDNQFQAMLILAIVGVVAMLFVRTNSVDRFYHGYRLTVCGMTVFQVPFRRKAPAAEASNTQRMVSTNAFFLVTSTSMMQRSPIEESI
ncbi:hypothetical protein LEN26_016769 [Aphanomyces euteiches]|nr:hypothetical protein LEN26_016769 [Aphanomyces euteiches]